MFLIVSLTSCAGKAIVRTETVTVEKPVIVGVPAELTRTAPEPVLPATVRESRMAGGDSCPQGAPMDELANCVLADHIDALRAWGRDMASRLSKIAGLAPVEQEAPREPRGR